MKHQNVFWGDKMTTTFFLRLSILAVFIFTTLLFGQSITFDKLVIKKSVKRAISPGEIHGYQIPVEKDQFVHLKIESPKVKLTETITNAESQKVPYAIFSFPTGFSIKMISGQSDFIQIQLKTDSLSEKGKYAIVLEELRTATDKDKTELSAKLLYDNAFVLENKGDAESIKAAQQKYTESLQLWQNINHSEMTIATLHRLGEICFKTSDYPGMQIYYYRALRHSRQQKDVSGEAVALYKIGFARMNKNEYF